MGKSKKHRIRKSKENEAEESSDEAASSNASKCSHIQKGVNIAAVRKAIQKPTCTIGECTNCSAEASKSGAKDLFGLPLEGAAASVAEDSEIEPTIWVCLQCGHQGCDRNSREKHALKHFQTPHSGDHSIVVNLATWAAWCYNCDNNIPVESSKRIQECVNFLRKQFGLPSTEVSHMAGLRGTQQTSQSDMSPTDQTTSSSQLRLDKAQVGTKTVPIACHKVKGLNNLGNTCFFNAVMQNLCQTHSLEALLITTCKNGRTLTISGHQEHGDFDHSISIDGDGEDEGKEKMKDLPPIDIVPSEAGPLTQSMLTFVQEMNNGSAQATVNPSVLFSQVCKKAPRFKGFQQQDSHELLRYLLDVIRSEEIKRVQCGILKFFKLAENTNPKKVDEETKMKVKEYGRQVKFTFLDSLFGGRLVSTITCEECSQISQIFEPFLDLSLPVTEEKPQRPNQGFGGKRKDSMSVTANAEADAQEEAAVSFGVNRYAANPNKPTKYQERKNRRQAKKEARRKDRKPVAKSFSQQKNGDDGKRCSDDDKEDGFGEHGDEHAIEEATDDKEKQETVTEQSAENDEEGSSTGEDQSDADVEDNIECETSRYNPSHSNHCDNISCNTNNQTINFNDSGIYELPIKGNVNMFKENHILPSYSKEPCDTYNTFIKDGNKFKKCAIDPTEIDDSNFKRTQTEKDAKLSSQGGSSELSSLDHSVGDNIGMMPSSAPDARDISVLGSLEPAENSESIGGKSEVSFCAELKVLKGPNVTGLEKELEEKLVVESGEGMVGEGGGDGSHDCPSAERKMTLNNVTPKPPKELYHETRCKVQTTKAPRYQPSSMECSVMSCLHQFTAAELLTGSNKVGCKSCSLTRLKTSSNKEKHLPEMILSNASKQYLIMTPPAVLTLHLKRFEQVGYTSRKVNRHVDFPAVLDLAPYCSSLCQGVRANQRKILYSLYGVVEHSGRLSGGHYTAYVKVRPSLDPLSSFLRPCLSGHHDIIQRNAEQVMNGICASEDDTAAADEAPNEALVPPGRWYHISDSRINEVTEETVLKAQAYLLFYERIY
ncbi:hypothetical protein C0Q70_11848 [Pomacea canaliculata]|uniref:ubiquitinyl hydrolase 1 n=2 Tax=Pomacea canaliculata TaxID=400727 RepID=A0A2T7P769_POMCA|nr:hypothetical protein C0Q70_11848 [Pomacea canaliculata]